MRPRLPRWIRSLCVRPVERIRSARSRRNAGLRGLELLETRDVMSIADINAMARAGGPAPFAAGIDAWAGGLSGSLQSSLDGLGSLPLVGKQLANAAKPALDSLDAISLRLRNAMNAVYASGQTDILGGLQTSLYDILGPNGLKLLLDNVDTGSEVNSTDVRKSPTTPDRFVQLNASIGQQFHVDVPLDLALADSAIAQALPGLDFELAANNGVRIQFEWTANLGIGFDLDTTLGFYLDAAATDRFGNASPEFSASINVFAAPPKTVGGQDIFSTEPGLEAAAAIGFLTATATDGTTAGVAVTAEDSLPAVSGNLNATNLSVVDYEFNSEVRSRTFTINQSGADPVTLATNLSLFFANQSNLTAANFALDHENPAPLAVIAVPDSAPGRFRLAIGARDADILRIEVSGGTNLGFAAGQTEDSRSRSLGFASEAKSALSGSNQVITAAEALTTTGRLAKDVDLVLDVEGTSVPLVVRANEVNEDITGLNTGARSLRLVLQEELNAALEQAFPAGSIPAISVSVTGANRVRFTAAPPSGGSAPVLQVQYQTLEKSYASATVGLDIATEDASGRIPFVDFFAAPGDFIQPTAEAEAKLRLHVNADTSDGGVTNYVAQTLGVSAGSLGLPGLQFDFAWDVYAAFDGGVPVISTGDPQFLNVELDAGSLINSIISPIANVFNTALGPVVQLIGSSSALMNLRLPVVSDLFGNRTLASLLGSNNFTTYLNSIIEIPGRLAQVVQSFTTIFASGKPIALGSWEYDRSSGLLVPAELGLVADGVKSISLDQLIELPEWDYASDFPGLTLNILQPGQFFNFISGRRFDIVSYTLPSIAFGFNYDFGKSYEVDYKLDKFGFSITADVDVSADLNPVSIIYDSAGIEAIAAAYRAGSKPDFKKLIDGLKIPTGRVVDVYAHFGGGGGLEVDILGERVIDISTSLSLDGRAYLDLRDPNGDGALRLNEIFALTSNFSNPLAMLSLFSVGLNVSAGYSLDAYIAGLKLTKILENVGLMNDRTISVGITSQQIFGNTALINAPGTPVLGEIVSVNGQNVLRVNSGPFASQRLVVDTTGDNNESFTLTGSGSDLTINFYGYSQKFTSKNIARVELTGGAGNDTLNASGLSIPIRIVGGGGKDTITGGSAADELIAGDGNGVTIDASYGGNDAITGGSGTGSILLVNGTRTSSGSPTIRAGSGAYTITLGGGAAKVYTESGDHSVTGAGTANHTYYLGTGNNTITTNSGNATVYDGPGSNTINFLSNNAAIHFTTAGGNDTIIGTAFADRITAGGFGSVRFEGRGGNDTLTGGSGNDLLDGGDGNDALAGNGGADTYNLGGGDNTASVGHGAAKFTSGNSTVNNLGGTGKDTIDATGSRAGFSYTSNGGDDTVLGSAYADTIAASGTGNVRFEGRDGDDTIAGGTGVDTLLAGTGTNAITASFADARVEGGSTQDTWTLGGTGTGLNFGADGKLSQATGANLIAISTKPGDTITVNFGTSGDAIAVANTTANLTLNASGGNDTITVTNHTGALTIDAGANSNTATIANVAGNVTVTGGTSSDTVTVSDITGTLSIAAGDGTNAIAVSDVSGATISTGGSGNDTATFSMIGGTLTATLGNGTNKLTASDLAGAATVTGGTGIDTVTANRVAAITVNADAGNDVLAVSAATGTVSIDSGAGNDQIALESLSGATSISLADGNDAVSAAAVSGKFELDSGTGDNAIQLQSLTGGARGSALAFGGTTTGRNVVMLGNLQQTISITGTGSDTTIARTDGVPRASTLSATQLATAGQSTITYGTFGSLQIDLGSGADTVTINGTSSAMATTVNAGGGDDAIAVTAANATTQTTVNGDGGTDTLTARLSTNPNVATSPFAKLGFTVDALVVDNTGYTGQIGWTFDDRVLLAGSNDVIDTTGATDVRLVAGSNAGNTLSVTDTSANAQRLTLGGSAVRITDRPSVIVTVPSGFSDANDAGFSGYERIVGVVGTTVYADAYRAAGPLLGAATHTAATAISSQTPLLVEDVTGDGILDLVFANAENSRTATLRIGLGDGTFPTSRTLTIAPTTSSDTRAIGSGDFNEDGIVDLVFANDSTGSLDFIFGTGSGFFGNPTSVNVTLANRFLNHLAVGDIDNDGNLDVVVTSSVDESFYIRRGLGNGSFHATTFAYNVYDNPQKVALHDIDRDGDLDVITALSVSPAPYAIRISFNQGNLIGVDPVFANGANYVVGSATNVIPLELVVADVTNDGIADILTGHNTTLNTWVGKSDGTFNAAITDTNGGGNSLAVADMNGDGFADVVSSRSSTDDEIVFNAGNGTGTLAAPVDFANGGDATTIAVKDLNRDGIPDVVALNQDTDTVSVLLGDSTRFLTGNAAGAAPSRVSIGRAAAVAVSPDGLYRYVSRTDNTLVVYSVTTGNPIQTLTGLVSAERIVPSVDNKHVYTLVPSTNQIRRFFRTADGTLSLGGADSITAPTDLAFDSAGTRGYVSSANGTLTVLSRNASTGNLGFVQTLTDGVDGVAGLNDATRVAIADDGSAVYVGGTDAGGSLAVFDRASGGTLTFVERLQNGVAGVTGLAGLSGLGAKTVDGTLFVFAVGRADHALVAFRSDPATGRLLPAQRLANGAAGAYGLQTPTDLRIVGTTIVVASQGDAVQPGGLVRFDLVADLPEPREYNFAFGGTLASLAVSTGSGNDEIVLAPMVGVATVTVTTKAGFDEITVADTTDGGTLTINAGDNDDDAIAILATGDNTTLTANGQNGNDRLELSSTGTGTTTFRLNGDAGNDTIAIDGLGIQRAVTVNGGTDADTFAFDAHGEVTNPANPTTSNTSVRVASHSFSMSYSAFESLDINSGALVKVATPATIFEGGSLNLSAANTVVPSGQTATYLWDLNGDGVFGDASGVTSTVPWNSLVALGLRDNGTYRVAAQVTLSNGNKTVGSAIATIADTAPTASATPGGTAKALAPFSLALAATDPSPTDPIAQWSVNWGDGVTETFFAASPTVFHEYAKRGTYTIVATATDADGATGSKTITQAIGYDNLAIVGPAAGLEGGTYTLNLSASGVGIRNWYITWGDGGAEQTVSGTSTSVTHRYLTDGPFTISARVNASDRNVGVFEDVPNDVAVSIANVGPTATISGAGTANEHASYTLTLAATPAGTDKVTGWSIQWGDGTSDTVSATTTSTTHVFADEGQYTITAMAIDGDGSYPARNTRTVTVADVAPTVTVSANGPTSILEAQSYVLNFTTTPSSGQENDAILERFVNWGDGTITAETGSTAKHVYLIPGRLAVTATARTINGTFGSTQSVSVDVADVAPTPAIAGGPSANEGASYSLTLASNALAHESILGWTVAWGDGAVQVLDTNPTSVSHVYANDGAYAVKAALRTAAGNYDATGAVQATILAVAPTLALSGTASVNEGAYYALGLSAASKGDGVIASWAVTWGDGSPTEVFPGTAETASHLFANGPATRTVSVTATDNSGKTASSTKLVNVLDVLPTIALAEPNTVAEGSFYKLSVSSFDPGAGDAIATYTVNWGDGTTEKMTATGGALDASHRYLTDGKFTVTVTGGDSSASQSVTVENVGPSLTITGADAVDEYTPYVLGFTATPAGSDAVTGWRILWGDGTSEQSFAASATSASHAYLREGQYTIRIVAVDADGEYLAYQYVTVNNLPPTPVVSGAAVANENVPYTLNLASNPRFDAIQSWTIQWGDGLSNTYPGDPTSATHTYANPGNYTIAASVRTDAGPFAAPTFALRVNDVPTVIDRNPVEPEDTPVVRQLLATDTDSTNHVFVAVSQPANGKLVLQSNGQYTYTPNANFHGKDSFQYTASDDYSTSNVGTVTITITPVNDRPVADGATFTTDEDSAKSGTLTASDVESTKLTFALAAAPTHGNVVVNANGTFTYTPHANYFGGDSFTFTANDGALTSVAATVGLTVIAVNDAPVADGATFATDEDIAKSGTLTASDVESTKLTFALAAAPTHGDVVVNADGTFTYTPHANYFGGDSFTFTASDGSLTSVAATVGITVNSVNDAPVADGATFTTDEDSAKSGTLTASDVESTKLTFALAAAPTHGNVVVNANGTFTYTPHANYFGGDSFTFTANDGALTSVAAMVGLTINAVNDAPVANGESYETGRNVPLAIAAPGVLANDTDIESASLAVGSYTQPAFGTVALVADGSFLFTPAAGFKGTVSFDYTAIDGGGGSSIGTVSIAVVPRFEVLVSGAATADEGSTVNFVSTIIDAAPGTTVVYSWTARRAGESTPVASGSGATFAFVPDDNGVYVVALTATDGESADSDETSLVVRNVAPTATLLGATVDEGGTATATFANVADASSADGLAGFRYSFAFAAADLAGSSATAGMSAEFAVPMPDDGSRAVFARVFDKDGDYSDYQVSVVARNVAPTVTVAGASSVAEGSPFAVQFGAVVDPGTDSVAGYTIEWGDGSSEKYSGSPAGVVKSHVYADGAPAGTARALRVFLVDEDGTVLGGGTSTTVTNVVQSVAITGAPAASIPFGTTIALGSSVVDPGADGPFSHQWSAERNGSVFATGTSPTFAFAASVAGAYSVRLTVTDKDGVAIETGITFAVTPVTVAVVAPPTVVRGIAAPFAFSAAGGIGPYTYTINWGDGSPLQSVVAGASVAVEHAFPTDGGYTVGVVAMAAGGGTAAPSTVAVQALVMGILVDFDGAKTLAIGGSAGADNIRVRMKENCDDRIIVKVNEREYEHRFRGTFANPAADPIDRLLIAALGGHDHVRLENDIPIDAHVDGGAGNDQIRTGAGDDIVLGGEGDDKLHGGDGRDILIGGRGADTLYGGDQQDILIAGYTDFDSDRFALHGVALEWSSDRTYVERIANLKGTGAGPRLNGTTYLNDSTVHDDGQRDKVYGEGDRDWFLVNVDGPSDTRDTTDASGSEEWVDIDP